MPGQFQSAYDVASLSARTQAEGQRLQFAAQQEKMRQEQQVKLAESVQKQLEMAVKNAADAAAAYQTKGGDLASPTFTDTIDPIVQSAMTTAQMAQRAGLPISFTPDLLQQQFLNIVNSPSPTQTAEMKGATEGIVAGAKETATKQAAIDIAKANPEFGDRKEYWDSAEGKRVALTDMEFANGKGRYVPVGNHDQAPQWASATYLNPDSGQMISGFEDPVSKSRRDVNGNPLGPEFVRIASPQLQGGPNEFGVTTASRTKMEGLALDLDEGISRLGDIRRSVKASYLTTGGQLKNQGRQILSRLGVQLGDAAVEEMTKQGTFETYVNDNVNRRIKELTGAAMGVEEAKRIIKSVPNLEQDPVTFMAVLEANENAIKAARMRLRYFSKQGLQWQPGSTEEPPIALEDFISMANRRASEIKAEVRAEFSGADEADIKAATLERLQAEGF